MEGIKYTEYDENNYYKSCSKYLELHTNMQYRVNTKLGPFLT